MRPPLVVLPVLLLLGLSRASRADPAGARLSPRCSLAGTLDANSTRDFLHSFSLDYVLDAGAASATRISLDFTYVQAEIAPDGVENGAAWGSNFYGSIVPAPGAMALLGMAGLAGRRRRD